mmetsp:Transcript_27735/g.63782  ORF Transcript_27735/g.63782 Transcript_27735/m.63782 type:complete len:202 (+) Transcript_27735:672-1277(+)
MGLRLSTKPVESARVTLPRFFVWHGKGTPPSLSAVASRLGGMHAGRELCTLFRVDPVSRQDLELREVLIPPSCLGMLAPGPIRLQLVPPKDGDDDDVPAALRDAGEVGRGALGALELVIARPGLPLYLTIKTLRGDLEAGDRLAFFVDQPVDLAAQRARLTARGKPLPTFSGEVSARLLKPVRPVSAPPTAKKKILVAPIN